MSAHGRMPAVSDEVANLDADLVIGVLARHSLNVSAAADELGVSSGDLRLCLWVNPEMRRAAKEMKQRELDLSEQIVRETKRSDDPRLRFAAAMFDIRFSASRDRAGYRRARPALRMSVMVPALSQWRTTSDGAARRSRLRQSSATESCSRCGPTIRAPPSRSVSTAPQMLGSLLPPAALHQPPPSSSQHLLHRCR